jgi:hypothetical protein
MVYNLLVLQMMQPEHPIFATIEYKYLKENISDLGYKATLVKRFTTQLCRDKFEYVFH